MNEATESHVCGHCLIHSFITSFVLVYDNYHLVELYPENNIRRSLFKIAFSIPTFV